MVDAPRVLILGGTGMLGHRAVVEARSRRNAGGPEVAVAVRDGSALKRWPDLFGPADAIATGDLLDAGAIDRVLDAAQPSAVLNAAGMVKQRYDQGTAERARRLNAEFPHQLAERCTARDIRLLHLSTDCVFSGFTSGPHDEDVAPDPGDDYGRDKLAGEPSGAGVLTVRTSLIGRELDRSSGLVEWLISADGTTVQGHRQARFSGLASATLAATLLDLLDRPEPLQGLFHLAAAPIDKYELLVRLVEQLRLDIQVKPVDQPRVDRSLDGSKLAEATGTVVPTWDEMLCRLAADQHAYTRWRVGP